VAAPLPFDVIIAGRFEPHRVTARWTDSPRESNAEIEAVIEREWGVRVAEAQRRGAVLYDGTLARYVSREMNGADSVTIHVGPTCYRDFIGTNLYHADLADRFGWAALANPIGTTALVITADGHLALGRRSDRVAFHAGYLHTIGGSLEAEDRRPDGLVDVFGSVLRELGEELDLHDALIRGIVCAGMIRDHVIRQPELLFEAELSLTRRQLAERLVFSAGGDEHIGVEACGVHPEAIVPFIRDAAPVAPVAVAALLLFGCHRWGPEWLNSAATELRKLRAGDRVP
jgi:hypothetical protein